MSKIVWLFPAFLLLSGAAIVQDGLVRDFQVARACAADVWNICSDVLPGERRIKACLKENVSALSNGCAVALLTAMAAARATPETKPIPIPAYPAEMTFDGLRAVKYCEVWLFRNTTGGIAGVYYNTTGLNNTANDADSCPAAVWEKVTVSSLEAQYEVLGAHKNGPRGWTMDWIRLPAGPVENFDGIHARWMGQGLLPKGMALTSARMPPYSPFRAHRESSMTFLKSEPVFILENLEGMPWVMQAFSQMIDRTLTYDTLKDLGSKLKPPAGWKFRVAMLDRDLTISSPQGYHWNAQDELQNTYSACKDGACNFQP